MERIPQDWLDWAAGKAETTKEVPVPVPVTSPEEARTVAERFEREGWMVQILKNEKGEPLEVHALHPIFGTPMKAWPPDEPSRSSP
jgi:hypothetical protein